jgi:hypothetical protein
VSAAAVFLLRAKAFWLRCPWTLLSPLGASLGSYTLLRFGL